MAKRKPDWLKVKFENPENINKVERLLSNLSLNTVCKEAMCPNKMECYNKGTATFMILGSICTRNCKFCNVTKGDTELVDPNEPENLGKATKELGLKHVVITSVTRDDLEDGGSMQFVECINKVREYSKETTVEVLIPDFSGDEKALANVVAAAPEILNHNVETVPSLYDKVRPMANYQQSLDVLRNTKRMNPNIYTKSGIMLGLGETEKEVVSLMYDLLDAKVDFMTIGQYLQPSDKHLEVVEFIRPEIFKTYEKIGKEMGFKYVASGPFVRSSYNAELVKDVIK